MRLRAITTILFILLEQIDKIFTQGMPVSPCPKQFQYRFDGSEWFGVLSVRNPEFVETLHLKVTLSIRGKPMTNYLGEIELLTRGQFRSDAAVLYKIKFPKIHMPPRLLQIMANNQVVCMGTTDQSIFVTQIILEHTRRFTFISDSTGIAHDDGMLPHGVLPPSMSLTPGFGSASGQSQMPGKPSHSSAAADDSSALGGMGHGDDGLGGKDSSDFLSPPPPADATHTGFGTKHFPMSAFEKNPVRGYHQESCGKIDDRIRFHVLHNRNVPESQEATAGGDLQLMARRGRQQRPAAMRRADKPGASDSRPPLVTTGGDADTGDASSALAASEQPTVTRGAWPWLAAIYVNNLTSLAYQCGGTLVAARVVISSAHCFHMFQRRYTANEVLVFLGRHNLKNWNEEGSMAAPVDDIFIHPDYDSHLNSYDADIVVILLKHATRFSTFIRPACLWSGSTKAQYIEGELGVVVGWGLANLHAASSGSNRSMASGSSAKRSGNAVPRLVTAPIISPEACFNANAQYQSLSSNRTFCAGSVAAAAAATTAQSAKPAANAARASNELCTGDSGAGLMIYKNNRWTLRGTVSASLPLPVTEQAGGGGRTTGGCMANQYVIYTDVAQFLDWILAFVI